MKPNGECSRERCEHHVARTSDVVDRACNGRHRHDCAALLKEQRAVAIKCQHHRVECTLREQLLREHGGMRNTCIKRRVHAGGEFGFTAIRRDEVRARILFVALNRSRVDKHTLARRTRELHERCAESR